MRTLYFTRPFIVVSPMKADFGTLRMGESATNSFLVENVGRGTMVGTATVPPPFKVLSGGSYKLTRNGAQVVTVVYTPDGARDQYAGRHLHRRHKRCEGDGHRQALDEALALLPEAEIARLGQPPGARPCPRNRSRSC